MRTRPLLVALVVFFAAPSALRAAPIVFTAPGMTVGAGDQGLLSGPIDLTANPDGFVLKATLNLSGLDDAFHTIFKLGVHDTATTENLMLEDGHGVWLATDHQWWNPNDFDPDPAGSPSQDLDDKLILQRNSLNWNDESAYNLPGVPPAAGNNHNIWFDRDGVDQWQALNPLKFDGLNYNTNGIYDIELYILATSATTGTAYLMINGLWQGFETNGNWNTMELSPAGMTFTGDMTRMQVFYGVKGWCYDGDPDYTNSTGCNTSTVTVVSEPASVLLLGMGLLGLGRVWRRRRS